MAILEKEKDLSKFLKPLLLETTKPKTGPMKEIIKIREKIN